MNLYFLLYPVYVIGMLVFLESILSVDNAAVLAAKAMKLPEEKRPPGFLQHRFFRFLGEQQHAALQVGILGAYGLRFAMLFGASYIAQNLWLRSLGAAYLVYLGVEYFKEKFSAQEEEGKEAVRWIDSIRSWPLVGPLLARMLESQFVAPLVRTITHVSSNQFLMTVISLEFLDLAFSLDNVVTAVAFAPGHIGLVITAVAIGMTMVRFGAVLFQKLIRWEHSIQDGAYVLVMTIGIELLVKDWLEFELHDLAKLAITAVILTASVVIARIWRKLYPDHGIADSTPRVSIRGHGRLRRGWVEKGTGLFEFQLGRHSVKGMTINVGFLVDASLSMNKQFIPGFLRFWCKNFSPFESFARKVAPYITHYDSDGDVQMIFFNVDGTEGDILDLNHFNIEDLEELDVDFDELGIREGELSYLLPVIERAYASLSSQAGVNYVFLLIYTDGKIKDFQEVKEWAAKASESMLTGTTTRTKIVLVVPSGGDQEILQALNHLEGVEHDIFDVVLSDQIMSGKETVQTLFEEQLSTTKVLSVTMDMVSYVRKEMVIRLPDLPSGDVYTIRGQVPPGIRKIKLIPTKGAHMVINVP